MVFLLLALCAGKPIPKIWYVSLWVPKVANGWNAFVHQVRNTDTSGLTKGSQFCQCVSFRVPKLQGTCLNGALSEVPLSHNAINRLLSIWHEFTIWILICKVNKKVLPNSLASFIPRIHRSSVHVQQESKLPYRYATSWRLGNGRRNSGTKQCC